MTRILLLSLGLSCRPLVGVIALQTRTQGNQAACASFLSTGLDYLKDSEQRGHSGGDWSPCTHLANYGLNFAPFVARFLAYQLAPETALEFGCGLGTTSDYVARFADADVTCIEPEDTLGELIMSLRGMPGKGSLEQLALNVFSEAPEAKTCVSSGALKKDLVFTLEVAEHIPAEFRPALIDFLVNSTGKWLVFSAARPGQGGTGHIPESMLTREQWRQIFEEKGLIFMPKLTDLARAVAYPARGYDLHSNLLVFKHPSNGAEDTSDPHEMLKDFDYWWGDNNGFENTKERADRVDAFDRGSNSALWPGLVLKEAQVRRGELCSPGRDLSLLSFNRSVARDTAFTSAWAAYFHGKSA